MLSFFYFCEDDGKDTSSVQHGAQLGEMVI